MFSECKLVTGDFEECVEFPPVPKNHSRLFFSKEVSLFRIDGFDRTLETDQVLPGQTRGPKFSPVHLRTILSKHGRIPVAQIQIHTNKFGKPFVVCGAESQIRPEFYFSLSHTLSRTFLAISNDVEIGIDCEEVRELSGFWDVAKYFFSRQEQEYIQKNTGLDKLISFYKILTRKEAIVKCLGIGINRDIQKWNMTLSTLNLDRKCINIQTFQCQKDAIILSIARMTDR